MTGGRCKGAFFCEYGWVTVEEVARQLWWDVNARRFRPVHNPAQEDDE